MNTWVCQYILECVDGDITRISAYFLVALHLFLVGIATLALTMSESKSSYNDEPTPLIITVFISNAISVFIVLLVVVISTVIIDFEAGFLIVFSAAIFTFILIMSSILIKNKRWKQERQ